MLAFAALVGSRYGEEATQSGSGGVNWLSLALFALPFIGMPLASSWASGVELFARFYSAGSLVFGGGHVVLPLLQQRRGRIHERFLVGYDVYAGDVLGSRNDSSPASLWGATGYGWRIPSGFSATARTAQGVGNVTLINASVVGLLLATLYQPVFVNSVMDRARWRRYCLCPDRL